MGIIGFLSSLSCCKKKGKKYFDLYERDYIAKKRWSKI